MRGRSFGNGFGVAASLALLGVLLPGCSGTAIRGARPWSEGDALAVVRTQPLARYQMSQCADVLGQPLPTIPDRLTLYRAGDEVLLLSEGDRLSPLVLDNRLHGDQGYTFQATLNGRLLSIQLPNERRGGHWLLASHWQEWEQQRGFGARPIRVVERCQLRAAEDPTQTAPKPAFGLAKAPQAGYGMGPVHERIQQQSQ